MIAPQKRPRDAHTDNCSPPPSDTFLPMLINIGILDDRDIIITRKPIKKGKTMPTSFWQGHTIRLRALEMQDIASLHTLFASDSDIERMDDHISFPINTTTMQRFHEPFLHKDGADGTFLFVIEHTNHEVLGTLATFDCDARNGCFKYSIVLARKYWGQGYAQEAIRILLRYYFRELRYQKVTILIYSFNRRSITFHETFGFHFEGRLRRMVYTNGQFFDELYYGLTNDEFDQLEPLDYLNPLSGDTEKAVS